MNSEYFIRVQFRTRLIADHSFFFFLFLLVLLLLILLLFPRIIVSLQFIKYQMKNRKPIKALLDPIDVIVFPFVYTFDPLKFHAVISIGHFSFSPHYASRVLGGIRSLYMCQQFYCGVIKSLLYLIFWSRYKRTKHVRFYRVTQQLIIKFIILELRHLFCFFLFVFFLREGGLIIFNRFLGR